MEQQDKRLETLHQQASTLYLQGEYAAALLAWRQLLQIDPRDERAREGVRLCEMLVQEEGGVVPQVSVPPPPMTPGAPADQGVGFGIGEDLDEELDELDELLGDGASTDWMDKAPQQAAPPAEPPPAPPAQPADGGAMEFDLSVDSETAGADSSFPGMSDEEFNLDGADRPAKDETASAIDAAFNFEAPAPPSAPPAEQPGPPPPAAGPPQAVSAEELQGRADDLMAEALEHYEAGERAEALIVLDRLAILDQGNQAAKTFANHIRAELEAQSAAQGHEVPGQPLAAAPSAAIDSPEIAEDLLADPVVEPTQEPALAAQIENGMVDFDGEGGESLGLGAPQLVEPDAEAVVEEIDGISTAAAGEEFDLDESDPAEEPALETAAKPKLSMNKWLMIAGIVLLAMGGGYVALQFLGGSGGDSESENTALAAPPPILDVEAIVGGSADPVPTEPADLAPSPAAAAVPEGYLDEVLDRADAAYEDGDYAAAVLAYNEALKLDPQNEVARRRLEAAGEFYREQKEQFEQRGMAIQAFNDGDYRNALRILYRITPLDEAEAERFERFKFNGWYNMGLRALKSGDCRLARSNLREAQQVDPTDRDLQWALELSGTCFEAQTEAYYDAARSLHPRAIND